MGPLILNTRPETDSQELEAALLARGYRLLSAPMLRIEFPPHADGLDLVGVQALIFTSANGVRAFAKQCDARHYPVLCVGDATARMARQAGFGDIRSADGDIEDLARLIGNQIDPAKGDLFHPAARKVAGDLGSLLQDRGFNIRRQTVYDAIPSDHLPDDVITAISAHHVDAVLFFSPRTAISFVKLIERYKLEKDLVGTSAICLSEAVKDRLGVLTWHKTEVAKHPTQEYLLSALENAFA
ncbi:uroporphyrinogen-III synthase [Thalassospira xiamenensis]|jgi:uroporphyrinogen-III synthase|uniref:Uroporphyrinogen-III synthase n=1 Tax=Thalassospira xiamenensis TaxID=220697 RepID=A0A367XD45_9PROT|nr:uroporphyrinogen-III synthase [Thalassospira xiamenensis]KZB52543.1 uroporphyrinogen III synthase [Thalassospira xiamenensis]MCK2168227.1 uroporphyrinogen-III synthase [Thalassospira xiamenensis]RCK51527.1 uroporphyrinogen III synthase [Thalassospira xiamenensis]